MINEKSAEIELIRNQISCNLLDFKQFHALLVALLVQTSIKIHLRIAMNDFSDHTVELRKKNGWKLG